MVELKWVEVRMVNAGFALEAGGTGISRLMMGSSEGCYCRVSIKQLKGFGFFLARENGVKYCEQRQLLVLSALHETLAMTILRRERE